MSIASIKDRRKRLSDQLNKALKKAKGEQARKNVRKVFKKKRDALREKRKGFEKNKSRPKLHERVQSERKARRAKILDKRNTIKG